MTPGNAVSGRHVYESCLILVKAAGFELNKGAVGIALANWQGIGRFAYGGEGRAGPRKTQGRMGDHIQEEEFVETIYACLLGELSWLTLLARIDALLPNAMSNFVMVGPRESRVAIDLSTNCPPEVIERYNGYYAQTNPWMPKAFAHPLGIGMTTDQLIPRAQSSRTEYYNDFMRPLGMKTAVGVVPIRQADRVFLLSTLSASEDADRLSSVSDLLTRLSPHLQRTFRFYERRTAGELAEKESLLGSVGVGVVFVEQRRFVRSASDVARAMMEEGCGISISPVGRIMFSDDNATDQLDLLLKRDASGRSVLSNAPTQGGKQFRYTFLRLATDKISEFLNGPVVAILIERDVAAAAQKRDVVFSACGLTPTEAKVAERMARGETVDEVAFAHGVSRETIRSQVKSVYAKLGVSRQVELLRLLR